ncbi:hypothetical protein O181_128407 [Austropuccinia psidii MF-1]|uniref:Uncharacterized protein n=1 Tax=Austropuccinia psidii MF-1 TaxID=1389203 RepID=A0A9Q3KZS8_9BASI|nr:hypothetical protein [Austropuccinia psidii MF-1]
MDLDQDIQVINPKDKNVSPEERDKWNIPELPPVPKDLNHFQQATIEIYQSHYKSWFMAAKQQERELLPSIWIGTMNSYLQVKRFMGPEKDRRTSEGLDTHVLQRTSPTDKSLVEKPKHVIRGPEEEVGPREGKQPSGSSPCLHMCQTSPRKPQRPTRRAIKRQRESQSPSGTSLTRRITGFPRNKRQLWTMCSIWKEL